MSESFGSVDREQLAGMRKLFETAGNVAEQSAQLQFQVMQEKQYQAESARAAEAYRQASQMAEKNPFVANRKLEDVVVGLSTSRNPRSQQLADTFRKLPKFDTKPTNVSMREITTSSGTKGIVTEEKAGDVVVGSRTQFEPRPLKTVSPTVEEHRRLLIEKMKQEAKTFPAEVGKITNEYRDAQSVVANSPYTEADLKDWSSKLAEDIPEFKAAAQSDQPIDWTAFIANPANSGKLTERNIDLERLKAAAAFYKAKGKLSAAEKKLKDHDWEYDTETDSFHKIGTKSTSSPSAASTGKKKIPGW